jgi:phospholipid/cholesterol/gamma-HCH transport system permease protein
VTREFAPLITGVLVAGRSGSALAARIGSMKINEEISALQVMGIHPVRYLAAPALVAMVIMVPALTWYADVVALAGAGGYVVAMLGISPGAYVSELQAAASVHDVMHGIGKSVLFGVLIAMVGVVNGAQASGGAEGIGRATTRSVVQAISAIVITDMIFAFVVTHY